MSNRYSEIKARAKLLNKQARSIQSSLSYARVVGLLSGLGFLIAPGVKPMPSSKVNFEEVLRIGTSVEPRVLEVLPAAVLSFPKSFLHLEKAPERFMQVVEALKSQKVGPDFQGIGFQKFFDAANRPTKNRKRKIVTERRIPKTFRFSPETIRTITKRASEHGIDQTAYVEKLIRMDSTTSPTNSLQD